VGIGDHQPGPGHPLPGEVDHPVRVIRRGHTKAAALQRRGHQPRARADLKHWRPGRQAELVDPAERPVMPVPVNDAEQVLAAV
jgi:hypothetical protein